MSGGVGKLAEKVGLPSLNWGLARLEAEERELSWLVDKDARGWDGSEHFKLGSIERLTVKARLKLVQRLLAHPTMREQADIERQQLKEAQERREREMQEELRAQARRPSLTELVEREQQERRRAEMAAQKRREEAQRAAQQVKQVEDTPILFIGIEGVLTSVKTRMFRRSFDPDAIDLIARLADRTGARLMLTSPMRTYRGSADALRQALDGHGLVDLWHPHQWMLPAIEGRTAWQALDAWLAGRACKGLIIDRADNKFPGELPATIGDYYTHAVSGFTEIDYFTILLDLGLEDGEIDPPPLPVDAGFHRVPASWRSRSPSRPAQAAPVRGPGPGY